MSQFNLIKKYFRKYSLLSQMLWGFLFVYLFVFKEASAVDEK